MAIPVVFKYASLPTMKPGIGRLWIISHQLGLLVAATGWTVRRQIVLAGIHIVLAVVVKLFVEYQRRLRLEQQQSGRGG